MGIWHMLMLHIIAANAEATWFFENAANQIANSVPSQLRKFFYTSNKIHQRKRKKTGELIMSFQGGTHYGYK
jgi:hypothetical protein